MTEQTTVSAESVVFAGHQIWLGKHWVGKHLNDSIETVKRRNPRPTHPNPRKNRLEMCYPTFFLFIIQVFVLRLGWSRVRAFAGTNAVTIKGFLAQQKMEKKITY